MRKLHLAILVIVAIFLAPELMKAEQAAEKAAQQSAEKWLALVDSGKYEESWNGAAQFFKNAVTAGQWKISVKPIREPLGKLGSRRLKSSTQTNSLPGAPDGNYVVLQFDTTFEHKQAALETVATVVEPDGKWRVCGYYIK